MSLNTDDEHFLVPTLRSSAYISCVVRRGRQNETSSQGSRICAERTSTADAAHSLASLQTKRSRSHIRITNGIAWTSSTASRKIEWFVHFERTEMHVICSVCSLEASLSSECCAAKLHDGFLLKVAVDTASGAEDAFCTDCEQIHFVQQRHGRKRPFFESERLSNYSLVSGLSRLTDWLLSKLNRSKCVRS